eukprot:CAMPEP_0204821242 /NCGR_PEP_ID=MMETSP1018-20131115/5856_1 /ASSEMBLY_ACC=CAM_ASM_000518 /TAXON_ID=46462 /ORGANISM="Anophryoides haemophila, Strain AH6" /LENGTH=75 /DNA_ID=CAMNT_0051924019 /DNA_START=770 /DNA_END=997 /DNA_ORIENTATION=+
MKMEITRSTEFGIVVGAKLVKGAYTNEEAALPTASILNDGFDATSKCYVEVAKYAISNLKENNEVLIALHNYENT